jgi:kinesin family member C2/C3
LALKDNVTNGLGPNISNNVVKTPLRRRLELRESYGPIISVATPGKRFPGEERQKGHWDPMSQKSTPLSGMLTFLLASLEFK